jgi:hypothetical protein
MHRQFWEAGYRIFELHPIANGKCGCGRPSCEAVGKHPLISSWQHTPSWSEEQIETMELVGHVQTGYGVLVRGLLVIDIDARNGGTKSYERLLLAVPQIAGAGLIVKTGSGNGSAHLYFKIDEGLALQSHLAEYPGIDFKSSGYVVGPGSLHASGKKYEIAYGSPADIDAAPEALIELLRKPERHRAEVNGQQVDVSHADLADMLKHIDPDCDHEKWVRCGMAVHHATGGTGFDVWDTWSANGTKYPGSAELEKRWHSFGKSANPVTLGTLIYYAEAAGWKQPVEFEEDVSFDESTDDLPFIITGVDLLRPPGLVGQITDWINAQCFRPRERLAVAAALVAVGNIAGLRYTDDMTGVTTNLFAFCVAGSGTGKEAILGAVSDIHYAAGIQKASHGSIKSEQEIVRDLIYHQAAFFVIDEIGIFLKKIKSAQQRGGAIYLDGIIGILMSAYSKANGRLLLSGDLKEDTRKKLYQEATQIERQIEDGNTSKAMEQRLQSLRYQADSIDDGLDRPFCSLIGFTTPIEFDTLVDIQNATNGFIGRSLLFRELDTAPKAKNNFVRAKMPEPLSIALAQLYNCGEYTLEGQQRIENYGDRIKIPSSPKAVDMMSAIRSWFDVFAYSQREETGLEALALRAYELVAKVSLILAVPEGLRTEEHVRWAFALVKRDIHDKTRLVIGNDRAKDSPQLALRARILGLIASDEGETKGYICNRLRAYRKPDIERCLEEMVKSKIVVVSDYKHAGNKSTVKKYRAS